MNKDQDKTKEQLITELDEPRKRISKLEATETERKKAVLLDFLACLCYL